MRIYAGRPVPPQSSSLASRRAAVAAQTGGGKVNIRWLLIIGVLLSSYASAQESAPGKAYRIAEPVQHGNLSVFLIHGADTAEHKNLLTLQEAMDRKLLVVHETSDVNQLKVE